MSEELANDNEGPFSIGQNEWPGIAKLNEECGEVVQIIGKLIATGGRVDHWSGLDLKVELEKEISDVQAAIEFVKVECGLDLSHIDQRTHDKLMLFYEWHEGCPTPGTTETYTEGGG